VSSIIEDDYVNRFLRTSKDQPVETSLDRSDESLSRFENMVPKKQLV
jgi:hypothetical protein